MNLLPDQEQEVDFWPAYSDLAIAMLGLLLLLLLTEILMNSRLLLKNALVAQNQEKIAKHFEKEKRISGICHDGNIQTFIFSADVLFAPDEIELSEEGKILLRDFGTELRKYVHDYTRIEIEGHADIENSTNFFKRNVDYEKDGGNWRLSAERAITVAQLFQREYGVDGKKLAVVGRSKYEPKTHCPGMAQSSSGALELEQKTKRDIEEQLRKMRRINVRILYSEIDGEKK